MVMGKFLVILLRVISMMDKERGDKKGTCVECFAIFGLNGRRGIVWTKGQVGQRRKI